MTSKIDPVLLMSVDHITRHIFPDILDRIGLSAEASDMRLVPKLLDGKSFRQAFISVSKIRSSRALVTKLDRVVDDVLYWINSSIVSIEDEELSKHCFSFLERSLTEVFSVGPVTAH